LKWAFGFSADVTAFAAPTILEHTSTQFSLAALTPAISLTYLFSAVRTAWPATRSAHSFLEFRAYPM
jgi:hypothetical protein